MLGVLTREYGIKPTEALTEYSEDEIQQLLSQLPADRLVTVRQGMTQMEADNRYMEVFCDRDLDKVKSAEEQYALVEKRATIKAELRTTTNPAEVKILQEKLDDITKQIEEAS